MSHDQRATTTDENVESHAGTKKELLVRRVATLNVVTTKSLDTHQTSYGLRATKTDGDAEGCIKQVLAHSGQATARGLRRWTAILRFVSGKIKP